MDSDSEVPTQTPDTENALGSQTLPTPPQVWGKLCSTTTYLKTIELDKPNFLLGRARGCDVTLSKDNFPPNCLRTVSKTHFVITYDDTKAIARITDRSKNGTYVNKRNVGEGKTIILQSDDEIAVGTKQQRVFIYHTMEKERTPYLPPELRQKYVTSRTLGSGAYGEVKLVFGKETGQEYAVKKIVKPEMGFADKLNTPERIQNEIDILKTLSHTCIISTEEIAETDKAVFIILEYMDGGDLVDRINSSLYPLPEKEIKLIFYQIALGVQYLHSRGVTHRDLKPGNVLLKSEDAETRVKLSDFGLSKIIPASNLMSTICGTPYYVAPEIIDMRCSKYTEAVDIWSLGVILFHMLSRDLPFMAKDDRTLYKLILSGKYSMEGNCWKSISEDAKDLVKQMLVRNPSGRIKIDGVVNHPWIAKDEDMQKKAKLLMNEDDENFNNCSGNALKKRRLNGEVLNIYV